MQIFCDVDGVKADFERGYEERFGHSCVGLDDDILWLNVNATDDFWTTLPLMSDWHILWNFIKDYNPIFLTGCPSSGYDMAVAGKREYILKHTGEIPVITCLSKNKQHHMFSRGDILIDDMKKNIKRWEAAGGVGILHKNAEDTIEQLKSIMKIDQDSIADIAASKS